MNIGEMILSFPSQTLANEIFTRTGFFLEVTLMACRSGLIYITVEVKNRPHERRM